MNNDGRRLLYNAIVVICSTILAIAFDRWWIVMIVGFWFWNFKED